MLLLLTTARPHACHQWYRYSTMYIHTGGSSSRADPKKISKTTSLRSTIVELDCCGARSVNGVELETCWGKRGVISTDKIKFFSTLTADQGLPSATVGVSTAAELARKARELATHPNDPDGARGRNLAGDPVGMNCGPSWVQRADHPEVKVGCLAALGCGSVLLDVGWFEVDWERPLSGPAEGRPGEVIRLFACFFWGGCPPRTLTDWDPRVEDLNSKRLKYSRLAGW